MRLQLATLAAAVAFAFSGSAAFAAMGKDDYKAQKDKIEAAYKADKAKCDPMKDNARDLCRAEAKGKEKVAKAELESSYKPGARNDEKLKIARADADYDVAREKCDDLKGDAKDTCKKDARAAHDKAKAEARQAKVSDDKAQKMAAKSGDKAAGSKGNVAGPASTPNTATATK